MEVIDVFVVDVSVDDLVQSNRLRRGEIAVGFHLVHDRQGFDVERAIVGNAAGGADLGHVLAESAIGSDRTLTFAVLPSPLTSSTSKPGS